MEYFVSFKILFTKTPFSDVTSGVFELLKKNKDQNRKQNEIHVCYWNISREPESTVDISESEIGEILRKIFVRMNLEPYHWDPSKPVITKKNWEKNKYIEYII